MDMIAGRARLDELWHRGRAFLGVDYAILGGAMTWLSERNLVSALSNGGGFGVIACGAMGPDLLAREIAATRELTERPFGVNLISMHPELDALIDVCAESMKIAVSARANTIKAVIRNISHILLFF